jgi:hypothetical protein
LVAAVRVLEVIDLAPRRRADGSVAELRGGRTTDAARGRRAPDAVLPVYWLQNTLFAYQHTWDNVGFEEGVQLPSSYSDADCYTHQP